MSEFWAVNKCTGHLLAYDPALRIAGGDMAGGPPEGYVSLGAVQPDVLVELLPRIIEELLERGQDG